MSGEIICMGSINMDLVMSMNRMPEPGETIITNNFNKYPGGKGGNQAVAASVMGGKVKFFGKLGDDNFSGQLIKSLADNKVDVSSIIIEKKDSAGIAMIRVDEKGQNSISFNPGANAKLSPKDVRKNEDLFTPGGILLITMEIKPETVYAAIRVAKKKGMFIILDPSPVPKDNIPLDISPLVDIVKPNKIEASFITDIKVNDFVSSKKAIKKLLNMGFSYPVITLGAKGVIACLEEEIIKIDPISVKVVDCTAAGDVFSGAFAASIYRGKKLSDALEFANAAATLSVTVPGAQSSIPALEKVTVFLKENKKKS